MKQEKSSIFSSNKMGWGGVQLKVKNEIVKSKINKFQRKFSNKEEFSNKSSKGNSK